MNKRARALEIAASDGCPGWWALEEAAIQMGLPLAKSDGLLRQYAEIYHQLYPFWAPVDEAEERRRVALCELAARIRSGDA